MKKEIHAVFNKICQIPGAEKTETNGILSISLPKYDGSDFNYSLSLSDNNEPRIAAINYIESGVELWYHSFNIHDYDSEKEKAEAFYSTIRNLFMNPTKIVQNMGLLTWSYNCYYYSNNSDWVEVYPLLLLKPLNILRVKRNKIVYRASKIISEF
jgi:hypothetical protein